jgi:hypothetical protein
LQGHGLRPDARSRLPVRRRIRRLRGQILHGMPLAIVPTGPILLASSAFQRRVGNWESAAACSVLMSLAFGRAESKSLSAIISG